MTHPNYLMPKLEVLIKQVYSGMTGIPENRFQVIAYSLNYIKILITEEDAPYAKVWSRKLTRLVLTHWRLQYGEPSFSINPDGVYVIIQE